VIAYISELLEGGKKFLLFAHHKSMMSGLQAHLRQQDVDFILIEGSTSAERRLIVIIINTLYHLFVLASDQRLIYYFVLHTYKTLAVLKIVVSLK
jgi:hypothetical protein